ncbi:MAG: hypothetical protein ACI9Y8_001800, partial [Candidatus Omnitrophota bacterium]
AKGMKDQGKDNLCASMIGSCMLMHILGLTPFSVIYIH